MIAEYQNPSTRPSILLLVLTIPIIVEECHCNSLISTWSINLVDTMSKHRSHEICRKIILWPRQLWTHIWALNKLGQRVQRSHGYHGYRPKHFIFHCLQTNSLLQPRIDGLGISQKTRRKGLSCWLSRNSGGKGPWIPLSISHIGSESMLKMKNSPRW